MGRIDHISGGMRPEQILILWLCAAAISAGCGGPGDGRADENYFRYNQTAGITSLDPAFARNQANIWAVNQIYNGLLQFNDSFQLQPCIARRWAVSDDDLTYTFTLRNDVYFADNKDDKVRKRSVTAHDFRYSFLRIMDPSVASSGAWIFQGRVRDQDPFSAPDDSTLVIHLNQPFRPFLWLLTMPYTFVVAREAVEHFGSDFRRNPVGTGPFMLGSWDEKEALILVRNPGYFEASAAGSLPYLDGVVVSFIENPEMEFLAFLDGRLDFVSDIPAGFKDQILDRRGNLQQKHAASMRLIRGPYLNTEYLGILADESAPVMSGHPLLQKEVRQAINCGFDREKMIRFLRNGKGYPALQGMVPRGMASYDSAAGYGYRYDPVRARALLAQAGYEPGRMPAVQLMTTAQHMDIAEFIQFQLAESGLRVNLQLTTYGLLRNLMERGEAPFFRASWIGDYPDPESYLSMFYSRFGAPPNYTRFGSEAFDALYERAVSEADDSVRMAMYRAMDSLVMEEAPVVPLYYDEVYRFVRPEVTGLGTNPMNLLVLKRVRIP